MILQCARITVSGIVSTIPTAFGGIQLYSAGDAATAIVYNAQAATGGTDIHKAGCAANSHDNPSLAGHINCSGGIYVALSGTTPVAYVYFE